MSDHQIALAASVRLNARGRTVAGINARTLDGTWLHLAARDGRVYVSHDGAWRVVTDDAEAERLTARAEVRL